MRTSQAPTSSNSCNKRAKAHRGGGCTLLELVGVVFVLALSAAIIMPYIVMPADSLEADAKKLSTAIRASYEISVSRKVEARLEFDFTKKSISWEAGSLSGGKTFRGLQGVELSSRGLVREGTLIVFLSPAGMNDHMTVQLVKDDRRLDIVFNPISGRVKVVNPDEAGR